MKKCLFCLIVCLFLFPITVNGIELDTYSNNVILYNLNDTSILFEKNSSEVVSIASLTKIMTAVVALDKIDNLDSEVTLINSDFYGLAEANVSVAGFFSGEVVTYRDLLYGLLLPSGADSAQALARLIAGGVDSYVKLMNDKVEELGLNDTHFMNTTGLDQENHHSTVRDVSKLFMYALDNPEFINIIKEKYYTTSNSKHRFKNTITRMQDLYNIDGMDYLIGGKTGTTGDAGLCLATVSEYDNVKYLLVTARAPYSRESPYNLLDAKNIYEYFMNNYSYKRVVNSDEVVVSIKTKYLKEDSISFIANKDIELYLENSFNKDNVEYKYTGVDAITADFKKGDKLGEVLVTYNGEEVTVIDILLDRDVEFDLVKYLKSNKIFMYIGTTLFFILISFFTIMFRRKRRVNK